MQHLHTIGHFVNNWTCYTAQFSGLVNSDIAGRLSSCSASISSCVAGLPTPSSLADSLLPVQQFLLISSSRHSCADGHLDHTDRAVQKHCLTALMVALPQSVTLALRFLCCHLLAIMELTLILGRWMNLWIWPSAWTHDGALVCGCYMNLTVRLDSWWSFHAWALNKFEGPLELIMELPFTGAK